jgi:hypothetical protein
MKITDVLQNKNSKDQMVKVASTNEVLKIAELLEALSEKDTILDDLAKLAVMQDVFFNKLKLARKKDEH